MKYAFKKSAYAKVLLMVPHEGEPTREDLNTVNL